MRITRTVGLTETTVDRLSEKITETIAALAWEGLTVVDVRYQACVAASPLGDVIDWYAALLLIGERA